MDWMTFVSAMGGFVVSTGIVGIFVGAWINHRFVQREKQREESRAVADILSEWVRPTYAGTCSNDDRWKIQTTYWKNILGLDKRLIDVLFPVLAKTDNNVGTNELIVRARQILLNLDKPDIIAKELNNWPPVTSEPEP
jgi:hypothetical protein